MWIEREIASEIKEAASAFPVVALVGPRQVGKTSILERLFPGYSYVSLDVATNAEAAETRPTGIASSHGVVEGGEGYQLRETTADYKPHFEDENEDIALESIDFRDLNAE